MRGVRRDPGNPGRIRRLEQGGRTHRDGWTHVPEAPKLRHRARSGGCSSGRTRATQVAARSLVAAVIAHAAECVEDVGLSVGATNQGPIRRYEAAGFVTYGFEPRALKIAEMSYDEILMILALNRQG